jgi:hypothetical protein
MKAIRRWLLESRLRSLDKVIHNAQKAGWNTVVKEANFERNSVRMKLFLLDG